MMWPSEREWNRLLWTTVIVLVAIGALLGCGLLKGCEYLREHVEWEWRP